MDRFYSSIKAHDISLSISRNKQSLTDPIQMILNNHKPVSSSSQFSQVDFINCVDFFIQKRITGSPLFLIVPNGPQVPHQLTSQRMKHWHNLFGSLGKVITVTVSSKPFMKAAECLRDIRLAVKDKIKECKTNFNEGRPLVLVGFGPSSLIAAHCALDNATNVTATICLGFPLTGINGFRGVCNKRNYQLIEKKLRLFISRT